MGRAAASFCCSSPPSLHSTASPANMALTNSWTGPEGQPAPPGFQREDSIDIDRRLGRPLESQARRARPAPVLRHPGGLHNDNTCAGLPRARDRLRRHPVDRHRRAEQPHRRARIATGPRNQRRTPTVVNTAFYPSADVERPLLGAVGRPVRQLRRASVPGARGHDPVPAQRSRGQAPADRAGPHSADRARRGRGLHRHEGHDRIRASMSFDDGLGGVVPLPDASRASATSRSGRQCSSA